MAAGGELPPKAHHRVLGAAVTERGQKAYDSPRRRAACTGLDVRIGERAMPGPARRPFVPCLRVCCHFNSPRRTSRESRSYVQSARAQREGVGLAKNRRPVGTRVPAPSMLELRRQTLRPNQAPRCGCEQREAVAGTGWELRIAAFRCSQSSEFRSLQAATSRSFSRSVQ